AIVNYFTAIASGATKIAQEVTILVKRVYLQKKERPKGALFVLIALAIKPSSTAFGRGVLGRQGRSGNGRSVGRSEASRSRHNGGAATCPIDRTSRGCSRHTDSAAIVHQRPE